jgi:hypothetical protein
MRETKVGNTKAGRVSANHESAVRIRETPPITIDDSVRAISCSPFTEVP